VLVGVPHRTREDFIYNRGGAFKPLLIPKDALIIPNIWWVFCSMERPQRLIWPCRKLTHDPERYTNPMVFDPSRFIATGDKKTETDPTKICFGFGRR
jgi:hypothetical protein